jgi:hypothetical protein
MARNNYATDVFINCPFDVEYKPIFEAIVFAVLAGGFRPRCALEIDDASEVRIEKIFKIIGECKYGVHDISRTEVTAASGLPRFNMPLELGMFLAAKRFGMGRQRQKICLILDSAPHRYQQFISDIAGQDIQVHNSSTKEAIAVVRNWLRTSSPSRMLPGGMEIFGRFQLFEQELPALCSELRLERDELTFVDSAEIIYDWLVARRPPV